MTRRGFIRGLTALAGVIGLGGSLSGKESVKKPKMVLEPKSAFHGVNIYDPTYPRDNSDEHYKLHMEILRKYNLRKK